MRLIDGDALIDALMTYTWRDEDERLIDDADEKREYIKQWLPDLPTVSGWVSVQDRLPDKPCACLVFNIYGWRTFDFWEDDGWEISDENEITHWMPLPPGPEVNKNADGD